MQTIETEHLTGRPFAAAWDKGFTRYPNLAELHDYHPYGEPAMCDHAGIEPELLHAVLRDGELLKHGELLGLARLYGCPVGVLACHKLIMLDTDRFRHRKMIAEVDKLYTRLKCMAREGNQRAERYSELGGWRHQRFLRAAYSNSLSYGHYFGLRENLLMDLSFCASAPRRRGLSSVKGGVA